MRRLFGLFLAVIIVAPLSSWAEEGVRHASGPAMWRLQSGEANLVFLGSHHMVPAGLNWQDVRMEDAMAAADGIVFETDIEGSKDPVFGQRMMAAGSLPPGETLQQQLSPEVYVEISMIAARMGLPIQKMAGFKPWMVALVMEVTHLVSLGFNPDTGVEEVLFQAANAAGKPVLELETLDEQLAAIQSLEQLSGDDVLKDATEHFDDLEYPQKMLTAWLTGDLETLNDMFLEDMKEFPTIYEALVVNRNRNWMGPIEAMIPSGGNYFIIAGAGHFVGEDSVIKMLEERGYELERF